MGRRRVTHELIPNESIRRVTFNKRKCGLLKKLHELTTLCGIPACAIIYSAYSDEPEVWPNLPDALSLLDRFHNLPIEKQTKYTLDETNFLCQTIAKANRDLEKLQRKNYCIELGLIASGYVPGEDLNDADYSEELKVVARTLEHSIRNADQRIQAAAGGDKI